MLMHAGMWLFAKGFLGTSRARVALHGLPAFWGGIFEVFLTNMWLIGSAPINGVSVATDMDETPRNRAERTGRGSPQVGLGRVGPAGQVDQALCRRAFPPPPFEIL